MFARIVLVGVLLAAAQPVATQQSGPETNPAVKDQVTRFEGLVKIAIRSAGDKLAREANSIEPRVILQFDTDPVVSGVIVPEVGPHFDVQIPAILPSGLAVLQAFYQFKKPDRPEMQPVATAPGSKTTVGATGGLPSPDSMTASPVVPVFDPTRAYTNHVREALLEAILDYSHLTALPLNAGERVTIVAKDMLDVMPVQTRQLGATTSRQLILTIKSEDLLAFRQGKITRDEAKQKIVDTRF